MRRPRLAGLRVGPQAYGRGTSRIVNRKAEQILDSLQHDDSYDVSVVIFSLPVCWCGRGCPVVPVDTLPAHDDRATTDA